MADSKTDSVKQSDLLLFKNEIKSDLSTFKQEMKHEYSLFINNVSNRIDEKLNKIARLVIGFVSVFVIAFWTYFEFSTDKVDQLSIARLSSMDERLNRMQGIETAVISSLKASGLLTDKKEDIKQESTLSPVKTGKKPIKKGK